MRAKHRDIQNIGTFKTLWITLTHKTTFKATLRLLSSAMSEFFIPQFQTAWRLSKRPVVSVDHPLDDTIPFRPELVELYLHFYPMWIKCLHFVYKEFGKQSLPAIRDFMDGVSGLYYEAGAVYRQYQSTTNRPRYLENARFRLIHAVDPHLHCVPSLHVMVVIFNYRQLAKIIDTYAAEGEAYEEQKDYAYRQAVKITESILFVKQHSVNCIPAALFVMSQLFPDFDGDQVAAFVDDLFVDEYLETGDDIKEYIRSRYRYFSDASIDSGNDFKDVILGYLKNCELVLR